LPGFFSKKPVSSKGKALSRSPQKAEFPFLKKLGKELLILAIFCGIIKIDNYV
jgi:hypothetical protein